MNAEQARRARELADSWRDRLGTDYTIGEQMADFLRSLADTNMGGAGLAPDDPATPTTGSDPKERGEPGDRGSCAARHDMGESGAGCSSDNGSHSIRKSEEALHASQVAHPNTSEARPVAWRRFEALDNEGAAWQFYEEEVEGSYPLYAHPAPVAAMDERAAGKAFDDMAFAGELAPVPIGTMDPSEAAKLAFVAGAKWQARAALAGKGASELRAQEEGR